MGQALAGPHGPLWAGPLRDPWAIVGLALVGYPPGPCGPGPPGLSWAGPYYGPPWTLMGRAVMGRALMGNLVNQRLGSVANPLNLLATLKYHKAIYTYICMYVYIYIYVYI